MNTQKSKAYRLAAELDPMGGVESEAANELRRLHEVNAILLGLVKRYRTETPLGHQPHMIALEADEVLAKATGETE